MFTTTSSAIEHVKSGLIRALAVSSRRRIPGLPDVPTMVESGFSDSVSSSWQGITVPAGTPKEIVQKLFTVFTQTMKNEDVHNRLLTGGMDVLLSKSPEEFQSFMASETTKWSAVVKESGATAD